MNNNKAIGILKLNTSFPRLLGDIGNPDSLQYPVIYSTVTSAIPANITVATDLPANLQEDFCTAAVELINQNVSVITTSCGFLITMQDKLSRLSTTPVICSALCLIPLLRSIHGGSNNIGVLTYNSASLNEKHLGSASIAVAGLLSEDSLRQTIHQDLKELDRAQALKEVIAACERLIKTKPSIKAILLECTNLSPYQDEIRAHTGKAVYDIVDAVHWLVGSQPGCG